MNLIDYKSIFFIVVLSFMNAAIECTHCKKDIKGEYYYLDDSKYHEDCYKKYIVPKCSVCKKSLSGSYMANEEGKYHNKCYRDHVLPKCSVCTNPLEKEYNYDAWGNKYHSYHSYGKGNCSSCSRIISDRTTNGGLTHYDGRSVCNICTKSIVDSKFEIEKSRNKVLRLLEEIGFKNLPNDVPISLKNRNELRMLMPNSPMISGLTNSSYTYTEDYYGNIIEEKSEYEIFILDKLPEVDFDSILAHEYLHVWLYENKLDYNSQITEGFCNLAKAEVYKKILTEHSVIQLNKMDTDPDPNYGQGYRIMNQCMDYYGWEKLIKLFKDNQAHYCYR